MKKSVLDLIKLYEVEAALTNTCITQITSLNKCAVWDCFNKDLTLIVAQIKPSDLLHFLCYCPTHLSYARNTSDFAIKEEVKL